MALYDIYAGLSGGFGGANYHGTYDYESENQALEDARRLAIEEYESYEGYHGIMSWEECKEDLYDSFGEDDITDEDINSHYMENVESWISYSVKRHENVTEEE